MMKKRVWFCAPSVVLARQQHISLTSQSPAYQVRFISGLDNVQFWSAQTVWTHATIPSAVPPLLQVTNDIRSWRTERMAKKDAAFQTYRRLHGAKLVNDNLLACPRQRRGYASFESGESKHEVEAVVDPWAHLTRACLDPSALHVHRVRVSGLEFTLPDVLLLLPTELDGDLHFELVSPSDGTISVTITPETQVTSISEEVASTVTNYLFTTILGRRLKQLNVGFRFPFYVIPAAAWSNPLAWLNGISAATPLTHQTFNPGLKQKPYLLKYGREEVLYTWSPSFDNEGSRQYSQDETIIAERLSKRLSLFRNKGEREDWKIPDRRHLNVIDCYVQGLPEAYGFFMLLMPSISLMLSIASRVQLARTGPLAAIHFNNSSKLTAALTSSSALRDCNYETLQFVGDSLLKYYASVQVYFDHPLLPEGGLSSKYGKLVNTARLQRATEYLGLDAYITMDAFSGPQWPLAMKESIEPRRQMSSKTLAGVMEALLGAAYLDENNGPAGDELPIAALAHLLPDVDWKSPVSHVETYYQTTRPSTVHIARLDNVEAMIGYQFKHKTLLVEALTHTNIRVGTKTLERLEFLGDAILDRIVDVALYQSSAKLIPESLPYRHDALVNRWFLCFLAMEAHHTINGTQVETGPSGTSRITPTPKTIRLIDHMRISPDRQKRKTRRNAEVTFLKARDEILDTLSTGTTFPWAALHSIDAAKSYSDVIESITGAVFIDSGGSLTACEETLESLGSLKILRRLSTESDIDVRPPVTKLRVKFPSAVLKETVYGKVSDGAQKFTCSITLDGEVVASFESSISRKHAEACATQSALDMLSSREVEESS